MKIAKAVWLAAAAVAMATPSNAAEYPERQITIVVPSTPASPVDLLGRYIAPMMEKELKQTVVVDNKPGAGGVTGSALVARAKPDGYTLLVVNSAAINIAPAISKSYPFDPVARLKPLVGLNSGGQAIVVSTKIPPTTLAELVEYAKARPGGLSFGSAGIGTVTHFIAEVLMATSDIKMVHLPYPGSPPAMTDLLAGNIEVLALSVQQAATAQESGKARVLAVATNARSPGLQNIPTVKEAGFPEIANGASSFFGFFAPAGTPQDIAAKLEAVMRKWFADPAFNPQKQAMGMTEGPMSADELGTRLSNDLKFFKDFAQQRNISVQ